VNGSARTYVVSGAASGIGAATTTLLREQGHRVVTVDLRDADVTADLSTAEGRESAVAGVRALADVVHGVVPAAGIGGFTGTDPALVVSVNYFGAVALVEGLRERMAAAGGSGVVFLAAALSSVDARAQSVKISADGFEPFSRCCKVGGSW